MTTDINTLAKDIAALALEQPDAVVVPLPKLSNAPAPALAAGTEPIATSYSRADAMSHGQALLNAGVPAETVIATLAKDGHVFEVEGRTPSQLSDAASAEAIAPEAKSEYQLAHLAAHADKLGGTPESVATFTTEARAFSTELQLPPALASAFFDRVLEAAATYDSKDEEGREQWLDGEKQAIAAIAHRYGGVAKMTELVEAALKRGSPAFRAKLEKSNTLKDRFTFAMLAGQGLALEAASRLRGGK